MSKTLLLGKLVMQLIDLLPIMGDLVVLDIAEVTSNVKFLGKGFANIPADVIHSGGPYMVLPFFKSSGVGTKLVHMGTNKQVFQVSGIPVAFVLVAQCGEVGHGNKYP